VPQIRPESREIPCANELSKIVSYNPFPSHGSSAGKRKGRFARSGIYRLARLDEKENERRAEDALHEARGSAEIQQDCQAIMF
jgi:hypothetical protein